MQFAENEFKNMNTYHKILLFLFVMWYERCNFSNTTVTEQPPISKTPTKRKANHLECVSGSPTLKLLKKDNMSDTKPNHRVLTKDEQTKAALMATSQVLCSCIKQY